MNLQLSGMNAKQNDCTKYHFKLRPSLQSFYFTFFLSSMIALPHYGHVINHIHSANPLLLRVCVGVGVCASESE